MQDFSKTTWKEQFFMIILLLVMAGATAYAFIEGGKLVVMGIEYAEITRATAECEKWQDWELVFPKWDEESQTGYFITPWQKEQCESVGIELRGHVVDYRNQ